MFIHPSLPWYKFSMTRTTIAQMHVWTHAQHQMYDEWRSVQLSAGYQLVGITILASRKMGAIIMQPPSSVNQPFELGLPFGLLPPTLSYIDLPKMTLVCQFTAALDGSFCRHIPDTSSRHGKYGPGADRCLELLETQTGSSPQNVSTGLTILGPWRVYKRPVHLPSVPHAS